MSLDLSLQNAARLDDPPSRHGGKPCVWSHENFILLFVFHLLFTVSTNCNGEKRPTKTSKYGQISAKLKGFRVLQQKLVRNPRFGASFLCGPSRRLCRVFSEMPRFGPWPFFGPKICNPGIFPQ